MREYESIDEGLFYDSFDTVTHDFTKIAYNFGTESPISSKQILISK